MPTLEEEQKKKALQDYLNQKFGGSSNFDVGVSQSTATVPLSGNVPLPELETDASAYMPKAEEIPQLAGLPPAPPPAPMPAARPPVAAPVAPPAPDLVMQALNQTPAKNPYTEEGRAAAGEASGDWGSAIGTALAGLGSAMSGEQSYFRGAMGEIGRKREEALKAYDRKKLEFEEKPMKDPNSQESAIRQKAYAEILGRPVEEFAKFSADQLDKAFPMIKTFAEQTSRKEMLELKKMMMTQGANEKSEKAIKEQKAMHVPGYQQTGEVVLSEAKANDLREGMSAFNDYLQGLKAYENMIDKYGTTELSPSIRGEMASRAKALQVNLKKAAVLGVLSESDIPFIEEPIPPPGFFKTVSGMKGRLKATKESAINSHRNKMTAQGYIPEKKTTQYIDSFMGKPIEESKSVVNVPGFKPEWEDEYQQWKAGGAQ